MKVSLWIKQFNFWPHVITALLIISVYGGYRYFAYHDTYSDDSYVSANIINVKSLVSGPVTNLYITDNQKVKKGQKLIEIDPRPYLYSLHKAKAKLNIAKLNYQNERLEITSAEQKLKQARLSLKLFQDHYVRFNALLKKGDIPEVKIIDITSKIREQEAQVVTAEQNLKIAKQNLDTSPVNEAKAIYNDVLYLYQHTNIIAPEDGYVTNFNLRNGQYIKVGEGLFALVETKQWWVVTRYRETAIRLIKPGDKARIKLDMYPGRVFHGHVESIGWGINRVQAGNVAPSTLAYLEATEDWIKIAQRFPVRIYFDDLPGDIILRIGASASTKTYSK
jgi:multidrug resistance efflux pump